jgi:pimeloyl-ACP methyl ester carboxylesterase
VVLLHGHPRTHATWHRVAPLLASGHTVVFPDLRGYGRSTLPADQPDHSQSSKRAMAADVVAAMRVLGHQRFAVVGHDRGGLVALRTAPDHDRAAGRKVACPMLFLQAAHDDIDIHGDPVAIWRPWVAGPLSAAVIDSGHHQAEEAPREVAEALSQFLAEA